MIETRSPHGEHTEELLQLNDPASVQYRLGTLRTVRMYSDAIVLHEQQLKDVGRLFRAGKINQSQYDVEILAIQQELDDLRRIMQAYSGELPLPPLRRQRLGVSLVAP